MLTAIAKKKPGESEQGQSMIRRLLGEVARYQRKVSKEASDGMLQRKVLLKRGTSKERYY